MILMMVLIVFLTLFIVGVSIGISRILTGYKAFVRLNDTMDIAS